MLYCVIFVLYVLGLLAKPMLVTLPCVCLLLDFWPLGRFSGLFAAAPIQPALVERPARAPGTPGRQRKAKRNQRLPARRAAAPAERAVAWTGGTQILLLLLEKVPLLALSAASAVITPYAQAHGGSMATSSDLSIGFRLENSVQSYMRYITRMFWPGKMSVLYLLDPDNVNHRYTALAVITLLTITGLVIWAAFYGRRYLAFGWFWYVGTLVPVIGIVQVGEQTHADRYTYIPYVGLFVMLAWGIADLINLLPQFRAAFRYAAGSAMILALATSVGWTKYQLQHWTDAETQLRWALTITPDNWNMLNNLGVYLWKQAQKQDVLAAKAEAEGDLTSAAAFHAKSVALKDDAIAQWIHGITARPTATDICSNLGYAYSERGDLDKAEMYLRLAVKLKEISPRPHNNLGRVLLRRSQKCEGDAREAEAKGEAAKAKQLRSEAKLKLDAAIAEFDRAVELDPWLLEARLNLGEVYLSPSALHPEKAEGHFLEIRKLDSKQVKDRETINNFSQGYFGLARVELTRNNSDAAVTFLIQALERNPQNPQALQLLAVQRFERGEYREGEKCLWPLLAEMPAPKRVEFAVQFAAQFDSAHKIPQAVAALNFFAWVFATSPEPRILDPKEAMTLAQAAVANTQQKDPLSIDSLAAALARSGQFPQAVQAAQIAVNLANSQGNKPLAEAISQRLQSYQQGKPYNCQADGSDRPLP